MKLEVLAKREAKTVYRDGDRVLKVFDESFKKSDILNEALNQARVEETGLNIPKILEVTKVDGKWAIISEYIEGDNLATLMAEHPKKKSKYLELFVDLQMEVHTKRAPLLNKLFFMGYIVLVFYHTEFIQSKVADLGAVNPLMFVVLLVGVQGLIEAIVCCAAGGVITRAVSSFLGTRAPAKTSKTED